MHCSENTCDHVVITTLIQYQPNAMSCITTGGLDKLICK